MLNITIEIQTDNYKFSAVYYDELVELKLLYTKGNIIYNITPAADSFFTIALSNGLKNYQHYKLCQNINNLIAIFCTIDPETQKQYITDERF